MKRYCPAAMCFLSLLVLIIGVVPGVAQQAVRFNGSQEEGQVNGRDYFIREYIIGPRDLLEIKVFELPEFDQTVRVSEDGSITLPLIGNVQVGGLTKDKAEEKLSELLQKYVKKAQVSIFIKEYQSSRVAIIGAVEKPGMYELVGRQTLLQMISQAGGFKDSAANEIYVLREGQDGTTASINIDLEELLINGNQNLNIPIQPNDVINVPIDKLINIYVFGEVKQPGALQVKMSKKITLLQAIAQAGGLTENATKRGVTIKRRDKSGKEINITVNLNDIIKGKKKDIPLQEGDVVIVKQSIF
ncbi:MAG TPA: polysaccharide biosynthesis/export family protein [Candidatus Saccharicenans sp.]|jgi:polysaccharide export outer membrane protein|nr:polysaccharide biosynthesis/export family protein [Candidatus Saccharicenans sp.]HPB59191.1 polysaccharide biosynthesis/export family protein [Candidatus Saccharicenans sp.]HQO75767.1 polysaccharide biosynthesis/export family protein [Candidatus Saccharicenans sp.]HUM79461.1 polysaccharide biosynthesis/export family protein [Candidatus Saccharicenans sp.]